MLTKEHQHDNPALTAIKTAERIFEEFDGFVYECKDCGMRFFQEGKPSSCCNRNEFHRMTFEQAIGLEKR